jgi:hypothetical protein
MVLNLMTLNIFSFFPVRGCKKNGEPRLAKINNKVITRKIGETIKNPVRLSRKSDMGLI